MGTSRGRRPSALLAGVVLVLSVAACAGSGPASDGSDSGVHGAATSPVTSGPTGAAPTLPTGGGGPGLGGPGTVLVSLSRTGGLAEGTHTLVVDQNRQWVHLDPARAPEPTRGTLGEADDRALRALLGTPALTAEGELPAAKAGCDDPVTKTVTVRAVVVRWQSCAAAPPLAGEIFRMLSAATSF